MHFLYDMTNVFQCAAGAGARRGTPGAGASAGATGRIRRRRTGARRTMRGGFAAGTGGASAAGASATRSTWARTASASRTR